MEEKKQKEAREKLFSDEQADMWRLEKEVYEEEERRLREKIREINRENSEFLLKQIQAKIAKEKRAMNRQEWLLNK